MTNPITGSEYVVMRNSEPMNKRKLKVVAQECQHGRQEVEKKEKEHQLKEQVELGIIKNFCM